MKSLHAELIDFYGSIVEELLNPTPPKLQNTDGDPSAPTRIEFALYCSPEEAVERLATLAYGHNLQDLLEDVDREAASGVRYTMPWLVPGNRIHTEWDSTSLGTIAVSRRKLEAEVNSERRARRLRKEVERRHASAGVLKKHAFTGDPRFEVPVNASCLTDPDQNSMFPRSSMRREVAS